jgi:hypothetical protein
MNTTAKQAYQALVEHIAAVNEPRDGFRSIADLPPLTDAQRGLVLQANPDLMNELEIVPADVAAIYAQPDSSLLGLYERLGCYLAAQLRPHVSRWLLDDVQAEVERENERMEVSRAEARYGRDSRSDEQILADVYGTASLFT